MEPDTWYRPERRNKKDAVIKGTLETRAGLACLYAGAVWGLFWIPLRALSDAGLSDIWATVVFFSLPAVLLLPMLIYRWRPIRMGGMSFQLTLIASGCALTLYSASIMFTDVIRALMLFYLMPVWSTLLARIFLKTPIPAVRVLTMCMAFGGMLVLFGLGSGIPLPRNGGDWMGVAAGFLWAITMLRLRLHEDQSSMDLTVGFFVWGVVIAAVLALLLAPGEIPNRAQITPELPFLAVFVVLLVIPGTLAALWGPRFIDPGIAGLLFMTEIVVGAISAALLAGEPFGLREVIGVVLIAGGSLLEPLLSVVKRAQFET